MQTNAANVPAPLDFDAAPPWLRVELAAQLAGGVSDRTIRRWIGAGYIRASKPGGGGVVLVDRDSLRSFLDASATGPRSAAR